MGYSWVGLSLPPACFALVFQFRFSENTGNGGLTFTGATLFGAQSHGHGKALGIACWATQRLRGATAIPYHQ